MILDLRRSSLIISHNPDDASERWQQYQSRLLSGFYFSPKVTFFQVDQKSLGLIAGKALKLTRKQIANEPLPSVEWRTTDNQVVEFTGEEFLSFADAAEEYAESVYKQVWAKKDAV